VKKSNREAYVALAESLLGEVPADDVDAVLVAMMLDEASRRPFTRAETFALRAFAALGVAARRRPDPNTARKMLAAYLTERRREHE
jgi:hypothetical protein